MTVDARAPAHSRPELRRVVIYGNKGRVGRETRDDIASLPCFTTSDSPPRSREAEGGEREKLTLGIPDLGKRFRGVPHPLDESAPNYLPERRKKKRIYRWDIVSLVKFHTRVMRWGILLHFEINRRGGCDTNAR